MVLDSSRNHSSNLINLTLEDYHGKASAKLSRKLSKIQKIAGGGSGSLGLMPPGNLTTDRDLSKAGESSTKSNTNILASRNYLNIHESQIPRHNTAECLPADLETHLTGINRSLRNFNPPNITKKMLDNHKLNFQNASVLMRHRSYLESTAGVRYQGYKKNRNLNSHRTYGMDTDKMNLRDVDWKDFQPRIRLAKANDFQFTQEDQTNAAKYKRNLSQQLRDVSSRVLPLKNSVRYDDKSSKGKRDLQSIQKSQFKCIKEKLGSISQIGPSMGSGVMGNKPRMPKSDKIDLNSGKTINIPSKQSYLKKNSLVDIMPMREMQMQPGSPIKNTSISPRQLRIKTHSPLRSPVRSQTSGESESPDLQKGKFSRGWSMN
jgi:hypothetical protein